MSPLWTKAPALWSALGIGVGIAVGYILFSALPAGWLYVFTALSFLFALCVFRLAHRSDWALAILALGAGFWLGHSSVATPMPSELNDATGTLTGKIVDVKYNSESTRLVIKAEEWEGKKTDKSKKVDFNVVCSLNGFVANVIEGSTIVAKGKLRGMDDNRDVPFQPDYNRFLFIDGATGRLSVYSHSDYEIDRSTASSFQKWLYYAGETWKAAIATAGFNEPTTRFLMAVVGGDDVLLSEDIEEQFRQTGLSHILAISGMHVAIILLVLSALLYPMKLMLRLRPVYFILLGALTVFYALVSGGSPSACRAAVMCCILMGDRLLEVRSNPLQALSMAVVILLCLNPMWLFLPGFQFSVCAVLGIIASLPLLNLVPASLPLLKTAWGILIMPLVGITATLIPTLVYFQSFTVNFWLANIVAAIFIPVIIVAGFIGGLLSLLNLYSFLITDIGDLSYSAMHNIVERVGNMIPDSRIPVSIDTAGLVIIGAIIGIIAWLMWNYTHRRAIVSGCAILLAIFMFPEADNAAPASELYIPRHYSNTDVLIVANGRNYLWTTARDSINRVEAINEASTKYHEFYRRRGFQEEPVLLTEGIRSADFSLDHNTLKINGKTLVRIDNDTSMPPNLHADIALISDRYTGNMTDLVKNLDADSIILSPAIHPSRHAKFERQLDTLGYAWRNMRHQGVAWQFR